MKKRFVIILLMIALFAMPLTACKKEQSGPVAAQRFTADLNDYATDVTLSRYAINGELYSHGALLEGENEYYDPSLSSYYIGFIYAQNASGNYHALVQRTYGECERLYSDVEVISVNPVYFYGEKSAYLLVTFKEGTYHSLIIDGMTGKEIFKTPKYVNPDEITVDTYSSADGMADVVTVKYYDVTVAELTAAGDYAGTLISNAESHEKYFKLTQYNEAVERKDYAEAVTYTELTSLNDYAEDDALKFPTGSTLPDGEYYSESLSAVSDELNDYSYRYVYVGEQGYQLSGESYFDLTDKFTLNVYKNGVIDGVIDVKCGSPLTFNNRYYFYLTTEIIDRDATEGYNAILNDGRKFKVTYHRYDIISKSTADFDPGFFITGVNGHIKARSGANAMLSCNVIEYVNGVAYLGTTAEKICYVDDGMRIGFDYSAYPIDNNAPVYYLANNRFLFGSLIIDEKGNTLVNMQDFDDMRIYPDMQVIVLDGTVGIDYDGKVVFEDKYSELYFTEGYAATEIAGADGVKIISKNYPDGVAPESYAATDNYAMYTGNYSEDLLSYGLFFLVNQANRTAELYNFAGERLMSVDNFIRVEDAPDAELTHLTMQLRCGINVDNYEYFTYIVA